MIMKIVALQNMKLFFYRQKKKDVFVRNTK